MLMWVVVFILLISKFISLKKGFIMVAITINTEIKIIYLSKRMTELADQPTAEM